MIRTNYMDHVIDMVSSTTLNLCASRAISKFFFPVVVEESSVYGAVIGAITSLTQQLAFNVISLEETLVNKAIVNIATLAVVFFATTKLLAGPLLGKVALGLSSDKVLILCLGSLFVNMLLGVGKLRTGSETPTPRPVRHTRISAEDQGGRSPLHRVACQVIGTDYVNKMKYLIKQGVDVNHRDYEGKTALHYVAEGLGSVKQKIEMIKILVENGARVDEKDDEGCTALHLVAKSIISNGKVEIAKILVDKGADVNEKNNKGETPLYQLVKFRSCSSEKDEMEMLAFLIEKGAKVDEKANNGKTALHEAVSFVAIDTQMEKTLIELGNADLEVKNNLGLTPFTVAAYLEKVDAMEILAEKGANVDARNNNGYTPLQELARTGIYHESMQMLIRLGAKVDVRDSQGNTALHLAAMNGTEETVKILINHGADVDATAQGIFQTPAYFAILRGHRAIVDILMKKSQSNFKWLRYFLSRAFVILKCW